MAYGGEATQRAVQHELGVDGCGAEGRDVAMAIPAQVVPLGQKYLAKSTLPDSLGILLAGA